MAEQPKPPSSAPLDRRALVEAYQTLLKSEAAKKTADGALPMAHRRYGLILGLVVIIACSTVLALRPAWFLPPGPPPETPAVEEASVRLEIFAVAQRIEAFRRGSGRLPGTLKEAGIPASAVNYVPTGSDFTLSARSGARSISFRSTDAMSEFLGDSYRIIRERSGK